MSAQVQSLRELLETRFPSAVPLPGRTGLELETGIGALDRLLPGGGVPRGRLTVWTPATGTTAALRACCQRTLARGERVAWIDAAGTLTAEGWLPGTLLVRPRGPLQALESAEELLRSGGVSLLVLAGCREAGAERHRLLQAAREGSAALVTVEGEGRTRADVRVATSVAATDFRWAPDPHGAPATVASVTVHAHVTAPGWDRRGAFSLPIRSHELRLSLESGLADRRGDAR